MANSKGDSKTRKVMDVSQPGKTAPSASAKPIIVTNRPILRRDPMMAPSTDSTPDMESATPETKPTVSRTAKTIKIMPLSADDQSQETSTATSQPAETAPSHQTTPAVVLEVGQEALASLDDPSADTKTEEVPSNTLRHEVTIEPTGESEQVNTQRSEAELPAEMSTAESASPVAPMTEESAAPTSAEEPQASDTQDAQASEESPAEPAPEQDATVVSTGSVESEPEMTAEGGDADQVATDGSSSNDSQLAPNAVHADTKRKLDQAAVERQAELEKLISSKQYYLPIKTHEKKRGTARSVVVLVCVILLAVIWLDATMDAGIVHFPGVQAPTHFFTQSTR